LKTKIGPTDEISKVKKQPDINVNNKVSANIKEGVTIRNISTACITNDGALLSFSIKNNLSSIVNDIKMWMFRYG